jgi:hypothetical protein
MAESSKKGYGSRNGYFANDDDDDDYDDEKCYQHKHFIG